MISSNLNSILSEVKKLNKADRAILLKRISTIVQKDEQPYEPAKLSQLSGLGYSLWQDVDIDKYIDEERQW